MNDPKNNTEDDFKKPLNQPSDPPEDSNKSAEPDKGETVTPKPPVSKPDPTNIKSIICKPKIPITIEETIAVDLVDKPRKEHWFRVRPFDPVEVADCWPVNVFEYEHAGEMGKTQYLLDPESEAGALLLMHGKLKPALIVLGMYFHGELFAWCVKTPAGQNRSADKWAHARVQCAMIAQERWITMESGTAGYSPRHAASEFDPPEWDKHDTDELLTLACKGLVIDSLDHEVIRLFTGRSES
jgi:hypothetical protein